MTPFHKIEQSADWNNALLSLVIAKLNLKNDAALCRLLDVTPPVISKIRSGKLKIGPTMAIAIHEVTGWDISEIKWVMEAA